MLLSDLLLRTGLSGSRSGRLLRKHRAVAYSHGNRIAEYSLSLSFPIASVLVPATYWSRKTYVDGQQQNLARITKCTIAQARLLLEVQSALWRLDKL